MFKLTIMRNRFQNTYLHTYNPNIINIDVSLFVCYFIRNTEKDMGTSHPEKKPFQRDREITFKLTAYSFTI